MSRPHDILPPPPSARARAMEWPTAIGMIISVRTSLTTTAKPRAAVLYTLAAGTVSEFTSASCYVVAVEDPDEFGAPAAAGEEGEEPAAEDPPAEEDGEGEEGGEDKPAVDYAKKVLEYVVAGPG